MRSTSWAILVRRRLLELLAEGEHSSGDMTEVVRDRIRHHSIGGVAASEGAARQRLCGACGWRARGGSTRSTRRRWRKSTPGSPASAASGRRSWKRWRPRSRGAASSGGVTGPAAMRILPRSTRASGGDERGYCAPSPRPGIVSVVAGIALGWWGIRQPFQAAQRACAGGEATRRRSSRRCRRRSSAGCISSCSARACPIVMSSGRCRRRRAGR